jgi:hypothetical protein
MALNEAKNALLASIADLIIYGRKIRTHKAPLECGNHRSR